LIVFYVFVIFHRSHVDIVAKNIERQRMMVVRKGVRGIDDGFVTESGDKGFDTESFVVRLSVVF
jgi:hypothetical protein